MTALNRNPTNKDLLQSTKFRVMFDRLPGVTYFCQTANIPGVSLTEFPRFTPFVDIYHPGEKIIYDTFNITFLVDEDLYAWTQLHDWIRGLTFPESYEEYLELVRTAPTTNLRVSKDLKSVYSQGTMTVYTNKNNPNFRIKMYDLFPTTVGSLLFNASDSAENIVTADATFRFSYYNYERI